MAHLIHQVERDFPPSSSSANRGTTPMHNATNLLMKQDKVLQIDLQAPSSSGGFFDVLLSKSSGHETDLVVDVESVDNIDVAAVTIEIDEQLDEDASENNEKEKDVVCSPPIVPYIGMEFDIVEEARNVYNAYAYKLGFRTRIASSRNSQASSGEKKASKKCKVSENGDNHDDEPKLIRREFECVHARKPENTTKDSAGGSSFISEENKENPPLLEGNKKKAPLLVEGKRKRPKVAKYDCKAHMAVGLRDNKWRVIAFQPKHTHPMVKRLGRRRYYRSHRHISNEDYEFLKTLHDRNIATSQILALLGDLHGGVRNLTFTAKDVLNLRTKLRQQVSLKDVAMTIDYFQKTQADNPSFFYAARYDEDNVLKALFWVDGRTRKLYQSYKDCVFFDTTFMTNRYNMPFAPIVGINNHLQTILLGCALICDETTETFIWIFETWMQAMNGQKPGSVMTDRDKAMRAAIKKVFPGTIHRCCLWHVTTKADQQLLPVYTSKKGFREALYRCIYDSETIDQFLLDWQKMVDEYDLHGNQTLNNLWETKEMWAPVYFNTSFFPFTGTTGRSEGLNGLFKLFVHPQDSVWIFVKQYEHIIETRLDREDREGYKVETTEPRMYSRSLIEKQASQFYTTSVFADKFQYEIYEATGLDAEKTQEVPDIIYNVMPSDIERTGKKYRVTVDAAHSTYSCSCHKFERDGLLCSHILRVMAVLNIHEIPSKYLLKRWSEQATLQIRDEYNGPAPSIGVPATSKLRFNALCRAMTSLASDACVNEEKYLIVSAGIQNLQAMVATPHTVETQHQ
ncbi:hypothetical protein OsI_28985 [Oryza sativa Indica Group]|uniref:Protein FAR1-RELATED SEQUENCE n=1 Tax=Oryza sativa subsp. indica TaxID=39946 RepID=B8BA79_ORYSI|nr:hypothetical protein OsI_28985 [Oryza sativa Indica Group]